MKKHYTYEDLFDQERESFMKRVWIRRRWVFVFILFVFLLIHQFDIYFVGPMALQLFTGGSGTSIFTNPNNVYVIIVTLLFFLVWGYNFDRHSRKKLLAGAGFLWWVTTWMMTIAPTFGTFIISYAAGGVDHASYSGIFALIGDYFEPKNRGKIFGFLLITYPLAFLAGLFLSNSSHIDETWRTWLFIMGLFGLIFALLITFFIHEPKRGTFEPAMADINMTGVYLFDWDVAKEEFKKPALWLIFCLSFLSIIPWGVLTNRVFPYFRDVQGLPEAAVYLALLPGLFGVVLGFPLAGLLGDVWFTYRRRGRVFASLVGTLLACVFLFVAFESLDITSYVFIIPMALVGLFLPFLLPNLAASLMDITLPELRGTAFGIMILVQSVGMLVHPIVVNSLQRWIGLDRAILWVCIGVWFIAAGLQLVLLKILPGEMEALRRHMAYRSHLEARIAKLKLP